MGCWVCVQKHYRNGISEDDLKVFDQSLVYAEEMCARAIAKEEKISSLDALYLYGTMFAFAKHEIGFMTLATYKKDISVATCKNGHMIDVTVYDTGIIPHEELESPKAIFKVSSDRFYPFMKRANNLLLYFEEKLIRIMNELDSKDFLFSHIKLPKLILANGLTADLPMKYAFSLYGSLLYCNASVQDSTRFLHGWDTIKCDLCGMNFIFADGWSENEL